MIRRIHFNIMSTELLNKIYLRMLENSHYLDFQKCFSFQDYIYLSPRQGFSSSSWSTSIMLADMFIVILVFYYIDHLNYIISYTWNNIFCKIASVFKMLIKAQSSLYHKVFFDSILIYNIRPGFNMNSSGSGSLNLKFRNKCIQTR